MLTQLVTVKKRLEIALTRAALSTCGRQKANSYQFLGGGRMRSKGFTHRELTVTWTVLVHNLWVLARLPQAQAAKTKRLAA
jgi:hypothetical protein